MEKNIFIAGVGGQGLVLASRIISEAAFDAGYDVKSNDVVGLAQRGGVVWAVVRYGDRIYAPLIPEGEADVIVGLEQLEALRWAHFVKKGGLAILNSQKIFPTPVLMEWQDYPGNVKEALEGKDIRVISVDARSKAKEVGNVKVANSILLGVLAASLDIDKEVWINVIKRSVPPKTTEENIKAFEAGYGLYSETTAKL